MFLKLLEKHEKDKILFATDSPWSDARKDIQAVRQLPIAQEMIEDILSNNAKRLLGCYNAVT